MDTATTKTRCEVVDQIVEWTRPDGTLNIEAGDLILDDGQFELVSEIRLVNSGLRVEFKIDSRGAARSAAPDRLVAVRRYIETTEE